MKNLLYPNFSTALRRSVLTLSMLLVAFAATQAQNFEVSLENDSTFNAAEDYARTSEGFDVDISKINVVNVGLQLAQDLIDATANDDGIVHGLKNKSYYRQRADLMLSSALPERTNVYSIISFINNESGNAESIVTVTNLEVEHFFNTNFKFRVGRLVNSVSESQFFGRIALEESSAHVYGRKIFVNDAIEFDGSFKKKGGPSFFIGLKPVFKDLNLKAVYAGIHQQLPRHAQVAAIVSVNRQFEADMTKYIPTFKGKDAYFSYEAEASFKGPTTTYFLNAGGNLGFTGVIPHTGGNFDFLKQMAPVVTDKSDSFRETFTTAAGLRIRPAKLWPSLKWLAQAGLEGEVQGALTDRFTALNLCAYLKVNITRRLVLTYYCTPQFIWQYYNADKPSYTGGVVNFLRLSVTVGKPSRMFL